jgi:hypothetical protein
LGEPKALFEEPGIIGFYPMPWPWEHLANLTAFSLEDLVGDIF